MFPHDRKVLDTWHWLGFGMISVDGIRSLAPLPDCNWTGQIRRAEMHDLEHVLALSDDLWHFMQTSPTFLLSPRRDRSYYEEWLQNPEKLVWLAYEQGAPVAFLQLGPADPDVCTIIQDESTTSIYAAFTKENVRGTGITTALLGHALRTARESGYTRCAVSFEPMNTVASRFWLRHFNPACYSVFRHIDERVIPTKVVF
jgi:GNAT superfamily N-acetyltransferase